MAQDVWWWLKIHQDQNFDLVYDITPLHFGCGDDIPTFSAEDYLFDMHFIGIACTDFRKNNNWR